MTVAAALLVACGSAGDAAPTAAPRLRASPVLTAPAARVGPDGVSLVVTFTESGLPPGHAVTLVAFANANATFTCMRSSGSAAGPELPLVTSASALARRQPAADGTLTGSLTIPPPAAAAAPCPEGLLARVLRVDYSAVTLSDVTNGVQVPVSQSVPVPRG